MRLHLIEGRHRVGVASEIPGLLRDLGYDPAPVITRAQLNLALLEDPENFITYTQVGRLLEICVETTGRIDFGMMVGGRGGTRSLGHVGEIMRNSATLGDAIESLCLNQPRYIKGAVAYLTTEADTAFWGYGVYEPDTPALEQICDAAVAVGANMLRELVQRDPEHVYTSRPRPGPKELAVFREILGVLPDFHFEQYAIVFPKSWLSLPVLGADPKRRQIAQDVVGQFWTQVEHSFAETVARYVRAKAFEPDLTADGVAKYFSMSPRTFNRRLHSNNTSFREIFAGAQTLVAKQLLASTNMSVTKISIALGYADVSAFTRAFSKAAQMSPSAWRLSVRRVAV